MAEVLVCWTNIINLNKKLKIGDQVQLECGLFGTVVAIAKNFNYNYPVKIELNPIYVTKKGFYSKDKLNSNKNVKSVLMPLTVINRLIDDEKIDKS
jgi:preprotein translocase subunit YajC